MKNQKIVKYLMIGETYKSCEYNRHTKNARKKKGEVRYEKV